MIQSADSPVVSPARQADFARRMEELSGQPVASCYQCQRCSSCCPVAEFMDLKPHQMVRLIQLGLADRLRTSRSPHLCVGCAGCGASCPNDIDFHEVADALRQTDEAVTRDRAPALTAFDRAFLASIRKYGRVHEMGMVMRFKLATRRFLADMKLGAWMFLGGKLKLFGRRIEGRKEIREIFRRARDRQEGTP